MKEDNALKIISIWNTINLGTTCASRFSDEQSLVKQFDLLNFSDSFYFIFNTKTEEIEYISQQMEKMLGYSKSDFNLSLMLNKIHPDDLPYYLDFEQHYIKFLLKLTAEQVFQYKFSYDSRFLTQDGEYKRLLQQVIPLSSSPETGTKIFVVLSDITHLHLHGAPRLSFVGLEDQPSYYNVHLNEEKHTGLSLTKTEYQVLNYLVEGKQNEDIAEKMCRSVWTIVTHRRNILQKTNSKNIQELLAKAIRQGLV